MAQKLQKENNSLVRSLFAWLLSPTEGFDVGIPVGAPIDATTGAMEGTPEGAPIDVETGAKEGIPVGTPALGSEEDPA